MPSAGNMQIVLSADAAKLYTTLTEAQKQLKKTEEEGNRLGSAMSKVGGGIVKSFSGVRIAAIAATAAIGGAIAVIGAVKFVGALDRVADKVDQIGKASKRLGISVEDLSAFRFAAGEAGVEFEQLAKLAAKALRTVSELVSKGTETLQIGRVKVQLTDANGQVRKLSDLLPDIARGLLSVRNQADQLRIAEDLFGKGGGEGFVTLLKVMPELFVRWSKSVETARRFGGIITDDQVEKLTAYRDAVERVQVAWDSVKIAIATEVAPVVTQFLEASAKRLADMPNLMRAGVAAIRDFGGDDPAARKQARAVLVEFRDASVGVLRTSAVELGKLAGATLAQAAITVFEAASPTLSDLFRDILAPVMNFNKIGVELVTPSELGKLRQLQKELAAATKDLQDLRSEAESLRGIVDNPDNRAEDTVREFGILKSLDARIEALSRSNNISKIKNLLRGQERAVAQQAEERSRALSAAIGNMFLVPGVMAEAAKIKIDAALTTFDAAADKLEAIYGPVAQTGTNSKAWDESAFFENSARSPVNFFQMLGVSIDDAAAIAAASRPVFESLYKGIIEGSQKFFDLSQDVRVRELMAGGDKDSAERLKLQNDQFRERRKMIEELGGVSVELVERLKKVQEAELKAFDAKKIDGLKEQLKNLRFEFYPDERLQAELENLKKILEAGLITQGVYDELTKKIEDKFKQVGDSVKPWAEQLEAAIKGFADSASDTLAAFVVDGKANFEDLANSWAKTLLSMALKQLVFQPFFNALSSIGSAPPSGNTGRATVVQRYGGAWERGVQAFAAGGVVDQPTFFGTKRGPGVLGEAGPEAILPLQRIGGNLGVRAAGGGTVVQIIDQRSGGARPSVTEGTGQDGRKTIRVLIRDEMRSAIADGSLDRAGGVAYNWTRRGAVR